ncbi:ATP-dependent helicase [Candidatus Poriferisodalis sp.]|uniref:ATP-dependent helicase n=1 Tax=Candidatus Poriferisodalis sp. TaxID=3101277 RepID=UPI003B01C401
MTTAAAFAGPPELGRSVLVRPGDPVPAAWRDCERVIVRPSEFSAETGRRLRDAWRSRTRLVIELDGDLPDAAPVLQRPWWELTPGLTLRSEVLAHLLSANAVDARDARRVRFAPVTLAHQLGATPCPEDTAGDVMIGAQPLWCDGGPLDLFEIDAPSVGTPETAAGGVRARDLTIPVLPAPNLAVGSLTAARRAVPQAELAPDQRAAVGHLGGGACIVAPAGSGKTRVLTERARYLVRDVGVAPSAVCLVAFNVRARREMQERTADLPGLEVRTLNSLALAICNGSGPFARPPRHGRVEVIDETGVRDRLAGLIKRRRRAMTDPFAPWLEALSASRLGLRSPAEVERDFQPDVPDFAELAPRFVESLSADGLVDFDQQVIRAIEILLTDPPARAAARRTCGVLLVDEFQDLTPAHLLMIRLLAGPRADVFAVGDDDQTIYGYAGASPQWLIDYRAFFPGADRHDLHVNYRCPTPVIGAVRNLLSHNRRRLDKQIVAPDSGGGDDSPASAAATASAAAAAERDCPRRTGDDPDSAAITVMTAPAPAAAFRQAVTKLLDDGARPSDIAVLARVNSTLLVPQIVLADMGVAADAPLGRWFIERTGVAGALAWLRLAVAPEGRLPGAAVSDAARRPPRGISPRVIEWIGEQRSVGALRGLAGRVSDERTSAKIEAFANDLDMLRQRTADEQLPTRAILEAVRNDLGLGHSLESRLDASRRSVDRSAHGDDLRALISVADMHPDPTSFPAWLGRQLAGTGGDTSEHGVRLATVHKVKGLEWRHVVVYDASEGLMPHRLALSSTAAGIEEERRVFHVALTRCSATVTLVCGENPSPFLAELRQPCSAECCFTEAPAATRRAKQHPPEDSHDAALFEALRSWRLERSRADAVPAFVVFADAVLIALATQRPRTEAELLAVPGIGPAKLSAYGAEVLAVIAEHA